MARGPLEVVTSPLVEALGRTLAVPLTALTDLPSFDTSAMDGWAVSGPGPWRITTHMTADGEAEHDAEPGNEQPANEQNGQPGDGQADDERHDDERYDEDLRQLGILAGHAQKGALRDGHAVPIATGARIPLGATAVLRSEYGEVRDLGPAGSRLYAPAPAPPGQDIRPRGQECRRGDQLLPAGALVTPAVVGLAAAAGYDLLDTYRRPRVEVLVLGDELLHEGLPYDGRIRDALGPMLGPWLLTLGAETAPPRHLGDDAEVLCHALTDSTADLVITTGGTASGPVDHVHSTLRRLEAEILVDGVAVRPGHPMLLARLAPRRHLVGLPGNPLAAVSGLLTLAEPLLHTLAARPRQEPCTAPLTDAVQGHPHDTRLVPVAYQEDGEEAVMAAPLHFSGPAMLRGIAGADALAVVPPGGAQRGEEVELLELPWSTSWPGFAPYGPYATPSASPAASASPASAPPAAGGAE
nr:molybdopterin molybdotransferase MoeA [Streptomyces sp. MST-110588]